MNALQSVSLMMSVLVLSGAALADAPPPLEPVEIIPAAKNDVKSKKKAEASPAVKAELVYTPEPAPAPVAVQVPRVQPAADGMAEARTLTREEMGRCLSKGRSTLACVEIVEGDIETAILNCGQRQLSKARFSAKASDLIENTYAALSIARNDAMKGVAAKARQAGAGPRQTYRMKINALYRVLAKAENVRAQICNDAAFAKLYNDTY